MPSSCAARLVLLASFVGGPSLVFACGGQVDGEPPATEYPGTSEEGTGRSSSGGGGAERDNCTALATCDAGDERIASESACPADASCYSRTLCGQTVWCTGSDNAQCAAVPVCPPSSIEVKDCPSNAECESVTVCGSTIQCMKGCEGPQPICDPGDTQVSDSSACLQDDAVCYSRSTCGYTIWCTGPAN